jgi:formamidopyrimidine-DNA glycosylase
MPELPEVETTRRGLQPHLEGKRIETAVVRNRALRQPVPRNLAQLVSDATVRSIGRRGKYLLFDCGPGTLIVHLGMSGRLWLVAAGTPLRSHDHFDLVMVNGTVVRLRDPRRFGLVLWQKGDALAHPLLKDIGPEPLGADFSGDWLYAQTRSRSAAIKLALMDSHLVAGIGNIYATKRCFVRASIRKTPAQRVGASATGCWRRKSGKRWSLRSKPAGRVCADYVGSDGQAGYFQSKFMVYDRGGAPCFSCREAGARRRAGTALDVLLPAMPAVKFERGEVRGAPGANVDRPASLRSLAFCAVSFKYFSCSCSLLSTCRGRAGCSRQGTPAGTAACRNDRRIRCIAGGRSHRSLRPPRSRR